MIFDCSPFSSSDNQYISFLLCNILDLFETEIKHDVVNRCCYEREYEVNSYKSIESFECEDNTNNVLK